MRSAEASLQEFYLLEISRCALNYPKHIIIGGKLGKLTHLVLSISRVWELQKVWKEIGSLKVIIILKDMQVIGQ
jgi:hypothetical protein